MTKITTSWADVRHWVNRAGQRPCLVSFFGQNIEVTNDCAVCKKAIQSVCQQMPYLLVRRSLRDGEEYEQNITRSLYKKGNKSATTYKSDCMELFSSNANLTTPFPRPSTERKHSLVPTLNEILSHLENTKLTSSAHLLIVVCEFVHHPVCYSLL